MSHCKVVPILIRNTSPKKPRCRCCCVGIEPFLCCQSDTLSRFIDNNGCEKGLIHLVCLAYRLLKRAADIAHHLWIDLVWLDCLHMPIWACLMTSIGVAISSGLVSQGHPFCPAYLDSFSVWPSEARVCSGSPLNCLCIHHLIDSPLYDLCSLLNSSINLHVNVLVANHCSPKVCCHCYLEFIE